MLDYINRLLNKWKHQPFANNIYIYRGKHQTNGFIFMSIDGESPILIYGESSYGKIKSIKWFVNGWLIHGFFPWRKSMTYGSTMTRLNNRTKWFIGDFQAMFDYRRVPLATWFWKDLNQISQCSIHLRSHVSLGIYCIFYRWGKKVISHFH